MLDSHIDVVAQFLNSIKNTDMPAVLEDIFTPAEIIELSERLQLLKKLKSGQTQREIASELGVSVTTVSRGSRVLKFGKQIISQYL